MGTWIIKGSTRRPGTTIVLGSGLTATEDSTGLLTIDTASGGSTGGSGTPGRLARWNTSSNLNDSLLSDDATNVTLTSGQLIFSAAASQIRPGATSIALRNNANSADNLLIADAGLITTRGDVAIGSSGILNTGVTLNRYAMVRSTTLSDILGFNLTNNDGTANRRTAFYLDATNSVIAWDQSYSTTGCTYAWRSIGSNLMTLSPSTGHLAVLTGSVLVGSTPANSGALRIPNNTSLSARNAANSGDVILISLSTADNTQILSGTSGEIQLVPEGNNAAIWRFGTTANPALFPHNTNTQDLGGSGNKVRSIYLGTSVLLGGTTLTDGALDLIPSGTASRYVRFRNDGDSNGLYVGLENSAGSFFGAPAYSTVLYSPNLALKLVNTGTTITSNVTIGSLGTFDSTAAPTSDYSMVYDGTAAKWKPRLISASVASSGVVNSAALPDGTQGLYVNTLTTSSPPSAAPGTPNALSIEAGYRCMILTMGGAANAQQAYVVEYSSDGRTISSGGTTASSGTFTSSAQFSAADVGRQVVINGAGASGATYFGKITAYTNSSSVTISPNASTTVSSATSHIGTYKMSTQGAATTGSSSTTLVVSGTPWTADEWIGSTVMMLSGSGAGQVRRVTANTTNTLTVSPSWTTTPANGDQYVIGLLISTANKLVHGSLSDGGTYWYRYRIVGGASAWISGYYPTTAPAAGTAVSTQSAVNAYGIVLASQIATGNLTAITSTFTSLTGTSGVINSLLTRKWQSSTTSSMGDGAAIRLLADGPTLYVKGDLSSSTDINRMILGNYTVVLGSITPQSDSTWSNNSPSVQVTSSTNGTFVPASSQPTNNITSGLPGIGNNYMVSGSLTTTNTMTSSTVVGYSSGQGQVRLEYSIDGGSYTSVGVVASNESALNTTTTINWTYNLTTGSTPSTSIDVRLIYEVLLDCTKVLSGSLTVSGAGTSVAWSQSGGTTLNRRGLYIEAPTSTQPHLALIPISSGLTQPDASSTVSGEVWMNGLINALEYNSNGSVVTLADATGSRQGLVRLTNTLGGTASSPSVVALTNASGIVTHSASAAPAAGMALMATSSTVSKWDFPLRNQSENKRHFGCTRAQSTGTTLLTFGIGSPTITSSGTGSSSSNSSDSNQNWISLTAGAANTRFTKLESPSLGEVARGADPVWIALVRMSSSGNQNTMWFGLTDSDQTSASGTAVGNCLMFFADTLAATCVAVSRDGTTQSTSSNLGALAASTTYVLKIRCSGSTVYFSINGGTETQVTANLPATSTFLGWQLKRFGAAAGTGSILVSDVYLEWGT